MRRAIVATNATARSFQLAALLLVGACIFFVLAYQVANGSTPAAAPPPAAGAGSQTLSPSAALPHVTYRADACGGDYVCDERGAWEITPTKAAAGAQLQTTELATPIAKQ